MLELACVRENVLSRPVCVIPDTSPLPTAAQASNGNPLDGSRVVTLQLGVSGKSKVPLAASQQAPKLSKLVNKGSAIGYLQHWGRKPTV